MTGRPHDDPGHGDAQRDAHLREALRHAPDAGVQPPAALSALILQEARAKARDPVPASPVATPPVRGPVAALWAWLARPAVGTTLAGVMAATLVGLMWWDQPMDPAMPRSPAPARVAEPAGASPTIGLTTPPAPTEVSPVIASADDRRPGAPEPARPAAAKPAPPRPERAADAAAKAKRQDTARERESQDLAAAARTRAALGALQEAVPATPAAAPAPAPAQAPAPAPAPVPTPSAAPRFAPPPAPVAAAAPSPESARMADEVPDVAAERQALRNAAPAERPALRRTFAQAKAELNETRAHREAEAFTAIASLRAEVGTDPSRWRWQRGGGEPRAMTDAVSAWLAQLDGTTSGRWQPQAVGGGAGARELRLLRDGQVQHVVTLGDREVTWQRGPIGWRAALSPEQAGALRSALDAAAP